MNATYDDRFIVYVRFDPTHSEPLGDPGEHPLASCSTYEEARDLRRILQGTSIGDCVIRFVGTAGGGD